MRLLLDDVSGVSDCNLLGGFGLIVQIILAVLSFSSLLRNSYSVKRYIDIVRRSWTIWFMDASKQGFGAGTQHIFNMIAALWVEMNNSDSRACTWYFLNVFSDVIIGTGLCYLFLMGIEQCLSNIVCMRFHSGEYGDPPRWCQWFYQLCLWLFIVVSMKICMIGIMIFFRTPLLLFGELLLEPFSLYPKLELVFVMILVPTVLNSLMFWVTDSFIRRKPVRKSLREGRLLVKAAPYVKSLSF